MSWDDDSDINHIHELNGKSSWWTNSPGNERSPPLQPVSESHKPRTELRAEEFVLGRTGLSCIVDGSCTKRISGVEGPAWQADVHVCDEIVSINGVFVSGRDFSGFDVVELCKKAARTDHRVQIAVRDFCTQDVRTATIDMTERSPMYSFLQEHKGETNGSRLPAKHSLGSVGGFAAGSLSASFESEATPIRTPSARDLHFVDDTVYESPLRIGGDSTGRGGWTWRDPGGRTRAVFFFIATVLACAAWTSWVLSDEASLKQLMDFFDSLERTLQVIPLCACTTIIRGGTYPVPFCRACKPHVLRWTDYSSAVGVSGSREKLCKGVYLRGTCKGSTETIKYLGKFDSLDECEAACLSYSVGRTRCRSFTYHFAAYKDKRFRHTCFGVTNPKWSKTREHAVSSGRVFGPLARVQRVVQWLLRKASTRVIKGWWKEGRPWDVLLAVCCVLFGLSGVRRPPTTHLPHSEGGN